MSYYYLKAMAVRRVVKDIFMTCDPPLIFLVKCEMAISPLNRHFHSGFEAKLFFVKEENKIMFNSLGTVNHTC